MRMDKLEKLLKAYSICVDPSFTSCEGCPYEDEQCDGYDKCRDKDTVELLKEIKSDKERIIDCLQCEIDAVKTVIDEYDEKSSEDECVYNNYDLMNAKVDAFEKALDIVKEIYSGKAIKKCPFCGSTAHLCSEPSMNRSGLSSSVWYVQCDNPNCGTTMSRWFSDHDAINAWNERK